MMNITQMKSDECGKCLLCGNYGIKTNPNRKLEAMIRKTNSIVGEDGKCHSLREYITCKDSGIYCAICIQCEINKIRKLYVGQTATSFSKRWSGHRHSYKTKIKANNNSTDLTDVAALALHTQKFHPDKVTLPLHLVYNVVFLQKADTIDVHIGEDRWKHKLKATINIAKTITTNLKS